MGQRNLS
nr:unnamed protein product [Callosobruchus chinensis]